MNQESLERRAFLKMALSGAAAGAAFAGVAGAEKVVEAVSQESEKPKSLTPVLTPEGKLVHVDTGRAFPCPPPPADVKARVGVPGKKWVMVIDLATCDGCGSCKEACSKMHFVPPDREWIKVLTMKDSPDATPYYFPKPCFHCDNPPCTKVCPVDATFKRQDGCVLVDNQRCIGCRFCMAACPYSVRVFNWGKPEEPPEAKNHPYSPECGFPRRMGTVEKCDFCPNLAAQGKLPACAEVCPMGSIYFGDQNEDAVTNSKGETERLSKLLKERGGYRYMEELGTQPRVYYLSTKHRVYPTPNEQKHDAHGTS